MMRWFWMSVLLSLMPTSVLAQSDVLEGTWSGSWITGTDRRACTIRFFRENDRISGEMLSPERIEFNHVSFDQKTLAVAVDAEDSQHGPFKIKARIEENFYGKKSRLNGTLRAADMAGELRLIKWTFWP